MAQENHNWDKVLELFFEFSSKSFTVREISKKTKVPSSTVQRYLERLRENEMINQDNIANINPYFKFKKTFFIIDKIYESGLINYLEENFVPETIILFGGMRKGDYDSESDIDLFVSTTKGVKLDLKKFEKKLGHNIQLFLKKDINELPTHLFNNVINGIKLSGYFKIK
ncbi:MAG: nucleotidyltransferase domain-containing protein [Nanoarchaeota archaeon]|nr:nucleotidyltransferase domain-containing protein [Nanoarchaeota archaeon]MBU1027893.1 nucleotidyltransferase domain-containing protein [Nanoarchaeota archaeon]